MDEDTSALVAALEEPYREYWAELGRFIHQFSETEREMQILLRHFSNMPDKIAAVLLAGEKVDQAISKVSRILDATENVHAKSRLEPVFQQLGVINGVRNNIVHWGATACDGALWVSNKHLKPLPTREVEYTVSVDALRRMTIDLFKIDMHISWEIHLSEPGGSVEIYQKVFQRVLEAAWRYKPPVRPTHKSKSQGSSPKQSRPRGASQKSPRGA